VVLHHEPAAGELAEVDEHVCPLGRREHQPLHRHRLVPHPALGADLPETRATDVEAEDPRVAAVEDPQAVHARLHLEEGPHLAVDEHDVAEVLADPGGAGNVARGIEERPVL
jgi:hypothetical protein